MRRMSLLGLLFATAAIPAALEACGGASDNGLFGPGGGDDAGAGDDGSAVGDGGAKRDGSISDGGVLLDGSSNDTGPACEGTECQVVKCDGGGTTTLSGTLYDPAKINPIYNAIVYIPKGQTTPLPSG